MEYSIGEMAKKLNITPSALRYYDKEGLLPFVDRTSGGIRVFKDSDFPWLATIQCLKATGMPIKAIRCFIDWCIQGDETIEKRLALIRRQRQAAEAQMRCLRQALDMLEYKEWYYTTALEAGTCAIHDTMEEEAIPPKLREAKDRAARLTDLTGPAGLTGPD